VFKIARNRRSDFAAVIPNDPDAEGGAPRADHRGRNAIQREVAEPGHDVQPQQHCVQFAAPRLQPPIRDPVGGAAAEHNLAPFRRLPLPRRIRPSINVGRNPQRPQAVLLNPALIDQGPGSARAARVLATLRAAPPSWALALDESRIGAALFMERAEITG
jgi:hypothetical protein